MTPRLTSSNRKLRTSAIAAMVAVSTVFTAVTPAFADTPYNKTNSTATEANADQPAGLNIADGSILDMAHAKVTDEAALKTATDNVADAIVSYGLANEIDMNKVFQDYRETHKGDKKAGTPDTEAPLNDTEAGVLIALKAQFAKITETLKVAAQNQADATATLTAALEADKLASLKFAEIKKYYASIPLAQRQEANKLIEKVNDLNTTGGEQIPVFNELTPVTPDNAVDIARAVRKHQINIWAPGADDNARDYVDRDYAKALQNLLHNKLVRELLSTFENNEDVLIGTQKSDIIPLQMFMDRARAQVLVLRILQAKYAVAIRMRDLYENDRHTAADKKMIIKDAYYNAMFDGQNNLQASLLRERDRLVKADIAAAALYKGWNADLGNSTDQEDPKTDQERRAYEDYRNSEAGRTYADITKDMNWQTVLERAQVIDRDTALEAAEKKADKEAAAKNIADANARQEESLKIQKENIELQKNLQKQVADLSKQRNADRDEFNKDLTELKKENAALQATNTQIEKRIAELLQPTPKDTPAPTPKGDEDKGKGDDDHKKGDEGHSDFPFVPLAIAGIVMAIIAAIAANFPVLLAALPKV